MRRQRVGRVTRRGEALSCYNEPALRVWAGAVRLLRGAVRGLVMLVGLATLLGLLDRVSWVFELADFFRLQYVAVLVGAALVALVLRRPRLAGVAGAFALVNVAVLGIPLLPTAAAADGHAEGSLRLVVANVEVGNTDFAAGGRLVAQTPPGGLRGARPHPADAPHPPPRPSPEHLPNPR